MNHWISNKRSEFLSLLFIAAFLAPSQMYADCYVSAGGNDLHSGEESQPFASLDRAQQAVRAAVQAGLKENFIVYVRSGVYTLDKPLRFGPEDGGGADYDVIYKACSGEHPVISGGVVVSGWERKDGHLWAATLSISAGDDFNLRQLYVDGNRLLRGRYPKDGFLKVASISEDATELQIEGPMPPYDLANADTEIVVIENWGIAREIIQSNSGNTIKTLTPMGWLGQRVCVVKPGMSVFLENSLRFLEQPGDWYFDRKEGVIYYIAAENENPNDRHFVASVREQLVMIEGTGDKPVRNLHFEGLEFSYSAWQMPQAGYGGIQACYYGPAVGEVKNYAATVAIELINASDCRFESCQMTHLGGSALGIGKGCVRNKITNCRFEDIGGNGPMVGYMPIKSPLDTDWADPNDIPVANEISKCSIQYCGQELYGAVGIFDAMTVGTRILHNEVSHLPYTGISVGYVWDGRLTSHRNCTIAYNTVHDVMNRLYDGGAIYTLGYQPGTIIRGNKLYDVNRSDYAFDTAGNNGIFFDQGSSGYLVEENVIYDAFDGPIRFNQTQHDWLTWRNNRIEE